jgi:hypothetical protein
MAPFLSVAHHLDSHACSAGVESAGAYRRTLRRSFFGHRLYGRLWHPLEPTPRRFRWTYPLHAAGFRYR